MANATAVYRFERDLARRCVGLSRVVTALDDGSLTLPGYAQGVVSFIVFERAEGDIRRVLNVEDRVELATRLRILHNMAAGVRQLHAREVAHQDVKPSNALVFGEESSPIRHAKLGDLGRATDRNASSPHDDLPIAGDPSYAPPEALYGAVPTDFGPRRFACDLYQLGSMASFIFTATTINALLHGQLHPSHHWNNWGGTYADVLPYVRDAFGRSVEKIGDSSPEVIAERVMTLVRWLSDPDPALRGHPAERRVGGNVYRLDRIVLRPFKRSRVLEGTTGMSGDWIPEDRDLVPLSTATVLANRAHGRVGSCECASRTPASQNRRRRTTFVTHQGCTPQGIY